VAIRDGTLPPMDLRRLRAGEWIAAAAGAALLASLFLPWYDSDGGASASLTGWEALTVLDGLLAALAVAALTLPLVTASQRVPAIPVALDALLTLAGIAACLLVLLRVLSVPDDAAGRNWALWLALGGALGIVLGGTLAMRDERLSPPGAHTDATGRPAPPPPEIAPVPATRLDGEGG
jgi:hypothetical protein